MFFEKNILCLQCTSIVEKRRIKEAKTNIYVDFLRSNIIFLYDVDNLLSKQKIELINQDNNLKTHILLIIEILLIIDRVKKVIESIFILAIHCSNRKVVYVNNVRSSQVFYKLKVDFIFEIDCDL